MAYTNETKLVKFNVLEKENAGIAVTSAGVTLAMNESNDSKYIFKIVAAFKSGKNAVTTGGSKLTIVGETPNVFNAYGKQDLELTFDEVGTYYIALDSAKYKQLSGANKGKVEFKSEDTNVDFTVSAIVLP